MPDPYTIKRIEAGSGITFPKEQQMVKFKIKYLPNYNLAEWGPVGYSHKGDAGFDLRAAIDEPIVISGLTSMIKDNIYIFEDHNLDAWGYNDDGEFNGSKDNIKLIPAGFCMEIPECGYQLEIRGRSGLASKYGIGVAQGIGTIDSGYRGEVGVILINNGVEDFIINPGDRIAQAVLMPYVTANFKIVEELDNTNRGADGFGSTGV